MRIIFFTMAFLFVFTSSAIADINYHGMAQCIQHNLTKDERDEVFKMMIFTFYQKDSMSYFLSPSGDEVDKNKSYIIQLIKKVLIEKCRKQFVSSKNEPYTNVFYALLNIFKGQAMIDFRSSEYSENEVLFLSKYLNFEDIYNYVDKYKNDKKNIGRKDVRSCVDKKLTESDYNIILKWMLLSFSEYPPVKEYYKISKEEKEESVVSLVNLINKIITIYCIDEVYSYKISGETIPYAEIISFSAENAVNFLYASKEVLLYNKDYLNYFNKITHKNTH